MPKTVYDIQRLMCGLWLFAGWALGWAGGQSAKSESLSFSIWGTPPLMIQWWWWWYNGDIISPLNGGGGKTEEVFHFTFCLVLLLPLGSWIYVVIIWSENHWKEIGNTIFFFLFGVMIFYIMIWCDDVNMFTRDYTRSQRRTARFSELGSHHNMDSCRM